MRPVTPVGGPTSKNTVSPVGGLTGNLNDPVSENTARPVSGLSGKKFLSDHASGTPDDSDPAKMGLDRIEMDLEMNT